MSRIEAKREGDKDVPESAEANLAKADCCGRYLLYDLMSMGADKAIRDASREHLAASAEVQLYLAEVKRLYGDAETGEKVKGLTVQLLENASYMDAKGNFELKVSVIKWVHGISMGVLCYLLACVACIGAQTRKS